MLDITLRPEQKSAVETTYNYWKNHYDKSQNKFLWNAKPRFGKTITAYSFAQKISAQRILIITNRPTIADSWANDYIRFLRDKTDYIFAMLHGANQFYSRDELTSNPKLLEKPLIFFTSFQALKTKPGVRSRSKVNWIFDLAKKWDLVIIDEGHEGVKTTRSEEILSKIESSFTLYLSGTPIRAISAQDFTPEQIYTWSYIDEQNHSAHHEEAPRLRFCLYSPSDIFNYDIKLPEIFASGDYLNQLINLIANKFHSAKNNFDFRHSLWLLSNVEECKKMYNILKSSENFADYNIVLAIGKNDARSRNHSVLKSVRAAIGTNPLATKTITLSCGQLTTGVTIPEWSAVLMLYNSEDILRMSSSQYLQAAFRAQNPFAYDNIQKTTAYVIDFIPSRALTALSDYIEYLCSHTQTTSEKIDLLLSSLDLFYRCQSKILKLTSESFIHLMNKLTAQEIVNSKFKNTKKLFSSKNVQSPPLDFLNIFSPTQAENKPLPNHKVHSHRTLDTLSPEPAVPLEYSDTHKNQISTFQDKLYKVTQRIPLAIHYTQTLISNLDELILKISDSDFQSLFSISKEVFEKLCQEDYLNQENISAAIQEFSHCEVNLSNYFENGANNIFDYIASPNEQIIFTPRVIAKRLVDQVEQTHPEIFESATSKFFDPCAKSGAIIAEIVARLYQNLRPRFSTDHDCLYHILSKQIFACASSEIMRQVVLTTLLSMHYFGKIKFTAAEIEKISTNFITVPLGEKHEKELIKSKLEKDMKFDAIISNPPYHNGRHQSYADFYRLCVDLSPDILCMIFPTGWQKPQNHNGLGQLNNAKYKKDIHLVSIDNYDSNDSKKFFPEVKSGELNIVLRDLSYDNHGKILRLSAGRPDGKMILPISADEIEKPAELKKLLPIVKNLPRLKMLGSPRNPYGFSADALRLPEKYSLPTFRDQPAKDYARLFGLLKDGQRGYKYIQRASIPKSTICLDQYKIFVPKAWGNMSNRIALGGAYANICVARPYDVCTETFVEFGPFRSKTEAVHMAKYFMTQFFRALLFLAKDSQNTSRDKYKYIPLPDLNDPIFKLSISKLDQALFSQYHLPASTQNFIMENIQPRDETNIEII